MEGSAAELRVEDGGDIPWWLCAAFAIAMHAAVLFAWSVPVEEPALTTIEGDSMEVALVESAPVAEPPAPEPPPTPPAPEVVPAPIPEPIRPPPVPEKVPEMTIPEPPPPLPTPAPPPPPAPTPPPPKPAVRTPPAPRPSNPAPKSTASRAAATTTAAPGTGMPGSAMATGRTASVAGRVSYIARPAPVYPPESRSAGEQGVVMLRLIVDGNGRPTSVTVARSSGFPRLDRAAVEAGWRCRVRDAAPGARLEAPVRFSLTGR